MEEAGQGGCKGESGGSGGGNARGAALWREVLAFARRGLAEIVFALPVTRVLVGFSELQE